MSRALYDAIERQAERPQGYSLETYLEEAGLTVEELDDFRAADQLEDAMPYAHSALRLMRTANAVTLWGHPFLTRMYFGARAPPPPPPPHALARSPQLTPAARHMPLTR